MKQLRPYQLKAKEAVLNGLKEGKKKQLLVMPGGCHAINTPIIMYNGTIKMVQDVIVGDQIMGDDSTPRNVLSLARGNETMYRITPVKGVPFIVNENHILSLKRTGTEKSCGKSHKLYINITLKDYIDKPKFFKHIYNLHRKPVFFNSDFEPQTHPYWIGLWLGDGSCGKTEITNPDIEIENWLLTDFKDFCLKKHPEVIIRKKIPKNRCQNFSFIVGNKGGGKIKNYLLKITRSLIIDNEKRIPSKYLSSKEDIRLQLLAGLLDTDGHLSKNGYEIITKFPGLSEDILFLARSLGFAAYSSKKIGSIKKLNFKGEYFRIFISGHTNIIPCKIKRKQAGLRLQIKDVLVTGFSVEKLDSDNYYGFSLDGNNLYLTGDFTVHHNTGKTATACNITKGMGRIAWITHEEALAEQSAFALLDEYDVIAHELSSAIVNQYGSLIELIRRYNANEKMIPEAELICKNIGFVKADLFDIDKPIVVCSAQTLWRRLDKIKPDHFQVVVADEGDLFGSVTFKKPLDYLTPNLLLGLTATPLRMDNMLMEDIFDTIIYEYKIEDAIREGYLTELNAIVVKTSTDLDDVHTLGGDFNQKELTTKVNTLERNNLIVNKYLQYSTGQQFICFGADIQHVIDLHLAFQEKGINTAYVVSDKDRMITGTDRKQIVAKYRKGEIVGLVNYNIFSAGFDHPDCGTVILACPTKSKRKFLQQLFRVTRLKSPEFVAKFGQIGTILDIVDGTSKHTLVNTRELDRGKDIDDRVFISTAVKNQLKEARLAREREYQEKHRKEDKKIQLFPIPKMFISTSWRMQEAATEPQLKWIKDLGYDIESTTYTKLMCSEIISNLPATKDQVKFLKWKGYDVADRVITRGEFAAAKTEIEKRESKMKPLQKNRSNN